jgi:hypothetical protein
VCTSGRSHSKRQAPVVLPHPQPAFASSQPPAHQARGQRCTRPAPGRAPWRHHCASSRWSAHRLRGEGWEAGRVLSEPARSTCNDPNQARHLKTSVYSKGATRNQQPVSAPPPHTHPWLIHPPSPARCAPLPPPHAPSMSMMGFMMSPKSE